MKEADAVRSYFSRPGFERFLKRLKRQYTASKKGVRGYVTLSNISETERETLDTFYGTYSPHVPGETKRYSLKKFEQLLLESRFGLNIPELLELLEGEPVLTRQEQERRMSAEWKSLIEAVIEEASAQHSLADHVMNWGRGLIDESSPGSRILRSIFVRSHDEARRCLYYCLLTLNKVDAGKNKRPIRLPILAAEMTGDAHALDWKNPLGRLFWWGLVSCYGGQPVEMTEDTVVHQGELLPMSVSQAMVIRDGYRKGGVADDDLSSQVMLYAPTLFGEREERVLTLRQVERLSAERLTRVQGKAIHMVENPSVFAELVDADASKDVGGGDFGRVLICGNGQPTSAVLKLLDALLGNRQDAVLYYAGDLDPAGLSIAQGLQTRYPVAFRAWYMDHEVYDRYAHKGVALTEEERSRLSGNLYDWDEDLAKVMADRGVKLHQELWVHELLQDIKGN